jgi:tRNA(Ile)-lysidine synthase
VRRALRTAAARVPDVFAAGTRLVVGFSGGQDSTCLLHALAHSHRRLELLAAHVDHGLRADSTEDAERVRRLAEEIGVPCQVRRVNVPKHGSVQQAARLARYRALAELSQEYGAKGVVVAHTADDQAETVLLHLLRGAGLTGLAGMRLDETLELAGTQPAKVRLVRPLLRVPRVTTLAYCGQLGLSLVEDASNQSRAYARNRVRLDLLPVLEQFNPAIRSVLARTADLAAEDLAALDALVAQLRASFGAAHEYNLRQFRAQPRALQRRLLRQELEALIGGTLDVHDAPIEDALDLLQSAQPEQTYHLPYGVELHVGSDAFMLRLDGQARHRKVQNEFKKTRDVEVPRV